MAASVYPLGSAQNPFPYYEGTLDVQTVTASFDDALTSSAKKRTTPSSLLQSLAISSGFYKPNVSIPVPTLNIADDAGIPRWLIVGGGLLIVGVVLYKVGK